MRLALITLFSFVSFGCAADVAQPGSLELGTGSWRFEALTDGQQLELVRGAQGGWHVWVSLRTRGLGRAVGEQPMFTMTVQPADESRPAVVTSVRGILDPENADGYRDFVGHSQVIPEPSCLVGEMMRLEASVEINGETLVVDRYFMVMGGTYPPPVCE